MSHRSIRIRGARTNNLKSVDIDVPRGQLVVFVGLSGSGKSSLVFDTIAAEAGHQLNETFPPFTRNRLPKWARPEVDEIDGLSSAVVIDQRRLGGNARSTVGTITDAWTYLRLLFSRVSTPHVGESNRFSFNDPAGMCPTCSGLGEVVVSAVERFLDPDKSLREGAILLPGFGHGGYWYSQYADIGAFDADTPLRDWTPAERDALLFGGEHAARLGTRPPKDYEGVVERFERIYLHTSDNLSERKQKTLARFTRSAVCPECHGDRLTQAARTATVLGRTIGEMARMEISELAELVSKVTEANVAPVVAALKDRLDAMVAIGLGYLHLGRATTTLSGGESQRVKTVKHLGSSLIEMLYIFDEPTVGLHPHDISAMTTLLGRLRDKGNSVLVVEHDPAVMAIADQIIEIGPGAGDQGGTLVFQGSFAELRRADTPTATALSKYRPIKDRPRKPCGSIRVTDASRNNLANVTVDIPTGVMTVLTGVAGSGSPASRPNSSLGTTPSSSIRNPSAPPDARPPSPTPVSPLPSESCSPVTTMSRRPCSAPTPRVPARTVRGSASFIPTWPSWRARRRSANPVEDGVSPRKSCATRSTGSPSPISTTSRSPTPSAGSMTRRSRGLSATSTRWASAI